jgi:hypothetical protein
MSKALFPMMNQEHEGHESERNHTKWCGILIGREECCQEPFPFVVSNDLVLFPKIEALPCKIM